MPLRSPYRGLVIVALLVLLGILSALLIQSLTGRSRPAKTPLKNAGKDRPEAPGHATTHNPTASPNAPQTPQASDTMNGHAPLALDAGTDRETAIEISSPREAEPIEPPRKMAPAVVPSHIVNESDPEEKKRLQLLHQMTTARIRSAALNRRARLLRQTIERETNMSTPPSRLKALEQQLSTLEKAQKIAAQELETYRRTIEQQAGNMSRTSEK